MKRRYSVNRGEMRAIYCFFDSFGKRTGMYALAKAAKDSRFWRQMRKKSNKLQSIAPLNPGYRILTMKRSNAFWLRILLPIVFLALMNGCSHERKRAALENYVKEVKKRSMKEIEPLPEMKPFQSFVYQDSNMRSPFSPPVQVVSKHLPSLSGIRPDVNRRKEVLENFPLDSLRMVGTVEKEGKRWALVVDTKGTVHRITKGNYVGQHEGKVDDITEEKVLITEIIPDPSVGWRERKASLALTSEADKGKK